MSPATRRFVPALLVAALVVGGCGGPRITDEASAALEALVDATWDAAEAGDVEAARGGLDDLRDRAQELHEDGELDQERLGEMLAAADAVEDELGVLEGADPEPQEPVDDADGDDDDAEEEGEDDDEEEGSGKGKKGKGKGKGKHGEDD